jgi:oxalate---CoA ligase
MSGKEQDNLSDVAMEKELLGIWRRALKNENLTIDDDFFECGGDSLLATQVLLEIEELTGKSLPVAIIFETGTVRQLLKVMAIDKFKPQVSFLEGPVTGKIIHFFHGDFIGGGAFIKTFSKMLGSDYLIHAIAPHLPHEGEMPNSIEDMAKERLQKILDEQPDGPYILLGQCNGALVGFEAARQLILMGKEVKAVVMVDPTIMSVRKSAQFIYVIANFFMRIMGVHKSKRHKHLIWIWRKLVGLDRLTKDIWRSSLFFFQKTWFQKRASLKKLPELVGEIFHNPTISQKSKERRAIDLHYFNVLFDYKPLSLNVPVLYIALEYSGHAWRRITRNTVYINIYRGHHTSWKEDYSQDLVDKIRDFINR